MIAEEPRHPEDPVGRERIEQSATCSPVLKPGQEPARPTWFGPQFVSTIRLIRPGPSARCFLIGEVPRPRRGLSLEPNVIADFFHCSALVARQAPPQASAPRRRLGAATPMRSARKEPCRGFRRLRQGSFAFGRFPATLAAKHADDRRASARASADHVTPITPPAWTYEHFRAESSARNAP